LPLLSQERLLVHTDENGFAINSYDAVAFFTEAKPMKGYVEHRVSYKGALYLFASEKNMKAFVKNPEKYLPKFGGYCPVALSQDQLKAGEPENFKVVDGSLYLICDSEAALAFKEEQVSFAQRYWKKHVDSEGLIYLPPVDRN
jgi:YHS domain-containing protein